MLKIYAPYLVRKGELMGVNVGAKHDDVIKWKHFSRYWPFVRGIHRFPSQRPVTQSFDVFFDLRLNKRFSKDAGDLRRHRAHYGVTVKICPML